MNKGVKFLLEITFQSSIMKLRNNKYNLKRMIKNDKLTKQKQLKRI